MKVAVICEYSGTVRDAFIRAGHDAISFDIIPSDSDFGPHVVGDVMELPLEYWEQFDLAICHPPCTYLSNAGARFLYPKGLLNEERLKLGLEAKEFFVYLMMLPIPRIAIENPIPSTVYELPKYDQIIQPYEYGHPFQKRTCLWLKNLPKLQPTNIVEHRQSTKIAGNWFNKGGKERQKNRAKTFDGIAEAMASQWGKVEVRSESL